MELLEQLEQYRPFNEQEARDREELLRRMCSGEDLYTRDNSAAHFTASAWVVSPGRDQPDENSRVGWFSPEAAIAASSEPWFRQRIYSKLNAKLPGW